MTARIQGGRADRALPRLGTCRRCEGAFMRQAQGAEHYCPGCKRPAELEKARARASLQRARAAEARSAAAPAVIRNSRIANEPKRPKAPTKPKRPMRPVPARPVRLYGPVTPTRNAMPVRGADGKWKTGDRP